MVLQSKAAILPLHGCNSREKMPQKKLRTLRQHVLAQRAIGPAESSARVFTLVLRLLTSTRRKRRQIMIKDYEVVTATRIAELQDRVRERIAQGWQPIGGIAFLRDEDLGEDKSHMVF